MIAADFEYRETFRRVEGAADAIAKEEQKLCSEGLSVDEAPGEQRFRPDFFTIGFARKSSITNG